MFPFFGHLHPVLVHLPIGILLLASLFLWQSRKDKYMHLQPAIRLILGIGMWTAIASCITGYLLYQSGDYEADTVNLHQWMGISVAVASVLIYYFQKKEVFQKWQLPAAFVLMLLIFVTGHLGGSITHGGDYLSSPLKEFFGGDTLQTVKRKPLANVQEAIVYTEIIQPIFQEKCYSCHGPRKQKGRLRLDQPDLIMKGGKDGPVILAGKAAESELIKRILLPREDEHHMAPKEKPALTESEILLLKWWVDNGADFSRKSKEFPQPANIKTALIALQSDPTMSKTNTQVPADPVERAQESAIRQLEESGVVVIPVAQNSHYLSANFITANGKADSIVKLLLPIRKQLIWLSLSNTKATDTALSIIAECTAITRLELDHTLISDKGLADLRTLSQLQSLNLVGTKITSQGIRQLSNLKQLESLYLFQTEIEKKQWPGLTSIFKNTVLDSGGYTVPFLETDTVIVKAPKNN